ncbi:related to dedicator of cytokinesis protein 3 [Pseudozyma flocculosa]|uniref:Related to dedicator of cytokinesis protein 3 n=1 Tax=Pseudozyma flocculosa TaxID=84751 RepID=A0A5C3EV90_9BASI|nr:related to dedicator of cytokinesis protein 3 [Pseudozyma flocculosa]
MAPYKRWEPLPKIHYGFSIHPFVPEIDALDPTSTQFEHLAPAALEALQNDLIALEVGDEVYVFEQLGHANVSWYRGYVVSTQRTATSATSASSLSDYSALPGAAASAAGASVDEEPQVYVGIFPASHVHIREQLDDAELRLSSIYAQAQELGIVGATAPLPRQNSQNHMETLPEVDETASQPPSPHGTFSGRDGAAGSGGADPRGAEIGLNGQLVERPPPPLPSLQCGDETAAGSAEPLVDEIACALREWAALMYSYLGRRDYALFLTVKEHIEVLHMARRQLLAQTLSAEEVGRLRRECVARLVKGNVAQGLDVIVRHPGRGGLVDVDFTAKDRDPDSWVSALRLFALQAASAYVDQDDESGGGGAGGGAGAMDFAASNAFGLTSPSTTASGILASTYSRKTATSLTRHASIAAAAAGIRTGGAQAGAGGGLNGGGVGATGGPTGAGDRGGAKYFHVLLDLKAFVASPCSAGETAELYFSLYNRAESRFLTEEFCVILNHNGAPVRETEGRLNRMRALFTDLSAADMLDLNVVCRIVRTGAMRLGGAAGDPTYDGRIVERGDNGAAFRNSRMASDRTFRRPFGCAVLELGQHHRFSPDAASSSTMREHVMPIFVPVNEAAFSTLHQDIIASRIKEFEKSPRADMLAVNVKVFHGETSALIRENPSLLADTPLTARLGFPDVVFPGDKRNEAYIKLWSGEFYPLGGKMSGGALKNIQVSAEVRTRDGRVVEHVISRGAGEAPVTQFDSIVFYHQNAPTWGELLKLQLPHDIMEDCHMFFSFRYRSSKEERALASAASSTAASSNGAGSSSSASASASASSSQVAAQQQSQRPFAHAYLPLFESNRAFIPDGSHTLFLWRVNRPPSQIGPDLYFNLPPVVPAGRTPAEAVPANLAATVQPLRDILTLRTFLVSTQYTQNDVLLELLNWERALSSDFEELRSVLTKFTFVGEVEIVKFLRDIFDALFGIAASNRNARGELDDLVFNGLVTVLGIVQDRRFTNFRATLDVYIERHFRYTTAHTRLIASMSKLLADPGRLETSKDLRAAIKVWPYLFRFIIQSRQNQRGDRGVGGGTVLDHLEAGFKRELDGLLRSINSLMSTTKPSSIIGTQTLALQHFAGILPDLSKAFTLDELVRIAMSFTDSVFITKGRMAIWKLLHILQISQGPLFESHAARSQLIPSVVRWIRPHLGRYDEASHVGPNELETARDTARVAWFEAARLSVTILAVILDRLQTSLAAVARQRGQASSAAADAELRQEQDNVDYVLSTMPKLLETYQEFGSRAMIKTLQRHRAPSTTASTVPVIFPSSYPFPLIAKRPQGHPAAMAGPSSRRHRRRDGYGGRGGGANGFLNCGLGEIASVLMALIMLSPRKHLASFLEEERDLGGHELCGKFLSNFFEVASSILLNEAFPATWLNINILAHQMVLKMADPLAAMLVRDFIPPADRSPSFDTELWRSGLGMLLTLLSSEQLVIEQFKPQRRRAVWRLAGDIRGEGAQIFAKLWTSIGWPEKLPKEGDLQQQQQQTGAGAGGSGGGSLEASTDSDVLANGDRNGGDDQMNTGGFQVQFVPSLVEPVLELCLSHHDELRTCAVRVLATMITSEWHLNGDFTVIEAEIIDKLDILFMTDTKGDEISRAFFIGQLRSLFDSPHVDERLREQVHACLVSVNRFLDLLLSVRSLPLEEGYEDDRIAGTLKLLGFLRQANRVAAFSTHVLRLANLHLENLNYVEAALTLKLHADLHTWDMDSFVEPIPELDLPKQSHFARKETLYMLILEYLAKGEAWEIAIDICRELAQQYEYRSVNYARLAEVLQHQAALYQRISTTERTFPSYFRVAYYGLGWPASMQNKMFVCRGLEWEKFAAFCDRLHAKHPKATLIKSTGAPGDDVRHAEAQFLQVTALQPEPDRTKDIFTNPEVAPIVRAYYEHNATDLFSFTRPLPAPRAAAESQPAAVEFQDVWVEKTYLRCEDAFPTVLRRSEVAEVYVVEISPLENALNDVQAKTDELETLEKKYGALGKVAAGAGAGAGAGGAGAASASAGGRINTNRLSMALNGAVDAPVNGGIPMYKRAFFAPAYAEANPDKDELLARLRAAIDEQALVIFRCIRLHAQLCPPEMRPFHDTLQRFFAQSFADEVDRLELDVSRLGSDAAPTHASLESRDDSLDDGGRPERFASRNFAFGAINQGGLASYNEGRHYSLDRSSRAQQAGSQDAYAAAAAAGARGQVPPSPLQRHISYLTRQGGSSAVLSKPGGDVASLSGGTVGGGAGPAGGSIAGGGPGSPSSPARSSAPFYEAPGIGGMPRPSMAPSDSTARADGSGGSGSMFRSGSGSAATGGSGGQVPQRYPYGVPAGGGNAGMAAHEGGGGGSSSLFSRSGGGGGGGNRLSKLMSVRRKPSQHSG